jgi:hypothetical protein
MKKLIVLVLFLMSVGFVKAQTPELDKYKSLFTLNFIRYINWPEEAKQGDFVIGVLKNSDLAEEITNKTIDKKFGYQRIVVKTFSNIDDVTDCQILYVSSNFNYSKYAGALATKLQNKSSLVITEDKGAIQEGSMINFVVRDNKLKFEISSDNASNYGLGFSNTLISMSNAIKM